MIPRRMTASAALAAALLLALGLAGGSVRAQDKDAKDKASQKPEIKSNDPLSSLENLNSYYEKQLVELDKRRISDLTKLAARVKDQEAEIIYQQIFNLAVARNLYDDAEKAAEAFIATKGGALETQALANFVNVVAEANRGEFDRSLDSLLAYVKSRNVPNDPSRRINPATIFTIGEAYFQRLVQAGRYDIARRVCEITINNYPDAEVKAHFSARLERVNMLGKKAPALKGNDADGKPVNPDDFKGKVVFVDFWATWCAPCVAEMPRLNQLAKQYKDQGFVVVGVNLDARREDVRSPDQALRMVRRFLLNANLDWPNIIDTASADNLASAFNVFEIPANFLIDRDGTIIGFDLTAPTMDEVIKQAATGQDTLKDKTKKGDDEEKDKN